MRMDRAVLVAIRRHLAAAYPAEGCGFLLGARGGDGDVVVARQLPVPNRREADGSSGFRYLIGPNELRAAEREAGGAGLLVVGTYHSHPDAPAWPSPYDAEHAWPWYGYLIMSVVRGVPREERVYELREDRGGFVERELSVTDAPDVKEV
jgi:proteasome lid subunit RPN8/RPN11